MAVRWKKEAEETGLGRVGAGPRTSYLHNGNDDWILHTGCIGGGYRGPVRGWYWFGMGQNTSTKPCATEAEAKAEAMAFYKASLLATT